MMPLSVNRVMIVEDEPRLRDLLGDALRGWGLQSIAFRTGEDALRAENVDADIVLLDLNLPGIGGLETLAELRQRKIDVPAIVLTGFGDLPAAQRAIELGVSAFLTKPCRLGELEQAIDRFRRQLTHEPVVLEENATTSAVPVAGTSTLDEVERQHILDALARHNGNRTATAAALGISRRTLQYRLAEYERSGYLAE
jgi:DNA-binding NtrC family response regulator